MLTWCSCLVLLQLAGIEVVTALISRAEVAMSGARQQYQAAVAARNSTGIMVIDRWAGVMQG